MDIRRGLIRPSGQKPPRPEVEAEPPALPRLPGPSAKLEAELIAHRTAALQADRPDVAHVTLGHALAVPVFCEDRMDGLDLRVSLPSSPPG